MLINSKLLNDSEVLIESPLHTPNLSAFLLEASPGRQQGHTHHRWSAAPALRGSQGPGPRWLPPAQTGSGFPGERPQPGPPLAGRCPLSAGGEGVGLVGQMWRRPGPTMEQARERWEAGGCLCWKVTPIINSHAHKPAFWVQIPYILTLKARLPLAKAPVGSWTGWPRNVALRVAGSSESVMLFQEKLAKEYGGYDFPGGLEAASDMLVLSNSNSCEGRWGGGEGQGLPEPSFLLNHHPALHPTPHHPALPPGSHTWLHFTYSQSSISPSD